MNLERPHISIASLSRPVVTPTGGPAEPGRNGGISSRTGGASGSRRDPFGKLRAGSSTPLCSARDDREGRDSGPDDKKARGFARNGQRRKAFTLIELMVVISVIGLLMALLLPALSRARRQARAVVCQGNLHQWGLRVVTGASDDDASLRRWAKTGSTHEAWSFKGDVPPPNRRSQDIRFCPMAARW